MRCSLLLNAVELTVIGLLETVLVEDIDCKEKHILNNKNKERVLRISGINVTYMLFQAMS